MLRPVNLNGINLIKYFEGFCAEAYLCPAGVLTIGYGHTSNVVQGQTITETQAEMLLRSDLHSAAEIVSKTIKVPLTDNQFAALTSFTFNCGGHAFATSTLCRKLNEGNYDCVPNELNRWVKAGGKTLEGLVKRRQAEGELWSKADNGILMPQAIDALADNETADMTLVADAKPPQQIAMYKVTAKLGLRVRTGPGKEFDVISVLSCDTTISIGSSNDDWVEVDLENSGNFNGWVYAKYLTKTKL